MGSDRPYSAKGVIGAWKIFSEGLFVEGGNRNRKEAVYGVEEGCGLVSGDGPR
jgi:hypothetical protein